MHVGVAHHLGWAVLVAATSDSAVINRRRIELIDAALPAAPIHHHGGAHTLHRDGVQLDDGELSELVGRVLARGEPPPPAPHPARAGEKGPH
ncbi:MAG: hypothetical protein AAGA99_26825 [Actinomycetota bacterium]